MSGARAATGAIAAVTAWKLGARVTDVRMSELVLDLKTAAGQAVRLVAEAIAPETWKISLIPDGLPLPQPTPMVMPRETRPVRLSAKLKKDGRLIVSGPELALEIRMDPFGLRFLDEDGRAVLSDNPDDIDGLGRPAVPAMGFIARPDGVRAVTASFHLRPDERLYGLGEKFTRLDKAGQKVVSWTVDALGSTSERSHKNVPFLWSSRGFGLFVDTGARITWDLGAASLQSWTFEAETPALDIYVFHGPRPDRILAAYTALTGRTPAVPAWSFGLWLSSGGTYRDQASIERLLDGIERHRLPADVIHIDPWWMCWRKYCDFEWDRDAFPDPESLIRRIHELGLKLCLWEHPYVSIESGLYEHGKTKGYFVKRPDGSVYVIDYGLSLAPRPDGHIRVAGKAETWNAPVAIIDLTNPDARAWFKDLHRPLLLSGVDVFKTDFGEDIPENACFHDGRTGAEMHNLYPLLYNAAVFEITAEEKDRGLVWSRSATAGSQRFPVCWSGDPASDWDSLAATIRGGLSAGLSGLALWSHDIGGYRGRPDPELYVRWAQFGLFSSHSRMHGDSPREPWLFGSEALAIVRKFAALRYRLFPYIQSAALEARDTGLPVLRALPLVFPDDPSVAAWDHEYMFGPSFLVAPVIRRMEELEHGEGRRSRPPRMPVYLPPGEWIDYWTGRRHRGPAVIDRAVALDIMPLFVRAGAIIPMMKRAKRIPEGRVDPLELELYPSDSASTTLFEADGRTDFRLEAVKGGLVFEWSGSVPRSMVVLAGRGSKIVKAVIEDRKHKPLPLEAGPTGRGRLVIPSSGSGMGRIRLSVRPADAIVTLTC
jgi:alpha-D-xyloside xylohydrolase